MKKVFIIMLALFLAVPAVTYAGFTPEERRVVRKHRWWGHAELQSTAETVYPPCLAALLEEVVAGRVPEVTVEIEV